MAISFVGSATGIDTATMPTHQAGDYIVVYAFRTGSQTAPTQPGGYTELQRTGSATSPAISIGVFGKIAASGSETVGTFTNAQALAVAVYRGTHPTTPAGTPSAANGNSTSITFQGLTLDKTDGSSWVVTGAIVNSSTGLVATPPSGMTNRANALAASGYDAIIHDTNSGVSSWSSATATIDGPYRFISSTFELKSAPPALSAASGSFGVTGSAAGLLYSRIMSAGGATFTLTGTAAGLLHGHVLQAGSGDFALSGQAAGLLAARVIAADGGAFSLTGADVGFATGVGLVPDSGSFALTGGAVSFLRGLRFDVQSASFAASSPGAGLLKGFKLSAASGSFTLGGQSATLLRGYRVAAQTGTFTFAGTARFVADLDGFPVNVFVSGAWKTGRLRIYRSGIWVEPVIKRWNGSSWV